MKSNVLLLAAGAAALLLFLRRPAASAAPATGAPPWMLVRYMMPVGAYGHGAQAGIMYGPTEIWLPTGADLRSYRDPTILRYADEPETAPQQFTKPLQQGPPISIGDDVVTIMPAPGSGMDPLLSKLF